MILRTPDLRKADVNFLTHYVQGPPCHRCDVSLGLLPAHRRERQAYLAEHGDGLVPRVGMCCVLTRMWRSRMSVPNAPVTRSAASTPSCEIR